MRRVQKQVGGKKEGQNAAFEDFYNGKPTDSGKSSRRRGHLKAVEGFFVAVFLPQGFPESVSDDYLAYQLWDTLQALSSSLTGALATEAVLTGAGVGKQTSTALAAAMTWILKDGLGMLGRISFSYFKGSELDFDCKKWRLVADVLNDVSFLIDLLNPFFPGFFLPLACTSSLLRSIVGVAGGATRATIVQHQARRNNLADVAAKDGSQETLVNVVALLLSLVLLPAVSGKPVVIWSLFMLFTACHILANYRAVRSLNITTLNRKRAAIAIERFSTNGDVPSVPECNRLEPLFDWATPRTHLGVRLSSLPKGDHLEWRLAEFETSHVVVRDEVSDESWVALKLEPTSSDCTPSKAHQQLFAFFCAHRAKYGRGDDDHGEEERQSFVQFLSQLNQRGYQTNANFLGFDEWAYDVVSDCIGDKKDQKYKKL